MCSPKEHVVDDIATELLDPNGQPCRGTAGSCTPSPIADLLVHARPGEYAGCSAACCRAPPPRPWPTARHSPSLRRRSPPAAPRAPRGGAAFTVRTNAELAFRAAVLGSGLGAPPLRHPPTTVQPTPHSRPRSPTGLTAAQAAHALTALLRDDVHRAPGGVAPQPDSQAWLDTQAALLAALLAELSTKPGQVVLSTFWDQSP